VSQLTRTTYSHVKRSKKKTAALSVHAFIKKRGFLNLLYLLLIAGIVVGVLSSESLNGLDFLTKAYMSGRSGSSLARIFFNSFSVSFLMLMLIFILGFCAAGLPLMLFLIFFQGFGFGLSAGYIYSMMAGKGLLYSLALVIPGAFAAFLAYIYACESGAKLSGMFFSVIFSPSKQEEIRPECRVYMSRFVIYILVIFGKAILEAVLSLIFTRFF
jgi:hypothetical protein